MFKNLPKGKWAKWSANKESILYEKTKSTNLQDTGSGRRLIDRAKEKYKADYLWGGWMEDRSHVLRGCYLEPSKFIHLGYDFFVPDGTEIITDYDAVVLQLYFDCPEEYGWGTRLLLSIPKFNITIAYGHLAYKPPVRSGDIIKAGTTIGFVGAKDENGGWAPHLHLQAITGSVFDYVINPAELDGYGEKADKRALKKKFPDPLPYVKFKP